MAPPDKEWMLWAKRFQIEHTNLLTRLKAAEELGPRITSLEEEAIDFTAINDHLQEQNNVLKDRVRQLEDEAVSRESACGEQAEQLKAKFASLENTLSLLIKQQKRLKEGVDARCDGSHKEIRMMKARIKEPSAFVQEDPHNRDVSPRPSQVTTEANNVQIDEEHKAQPKNVSPLNIDIKAQGDEALEEYVRYGTSFLAQEIRQHDIRAAKAFVLGMKSEYYRAPLWRKLEKMGWSTRSAVEEAFRMVEDGKRRKRKRECLLQQLR